MSRTHPLKKYKSYCFTLNNYSLSEYEHIKEFLSLSSDYSCIGKEVGVQGTPHLQGYSKFKQSYSISELKNVLSSRAHFEVARGKASDSRTYCSKEGDFWENGTCPGTSNKRTRDDLAKEYRGRLVEGRQGIIRFADDNPGVFAWSGHTLLRNSLGLAGAVPRPNISVRWIWGPPGVGKSRFAHETFPEGYIKEPRTKWWNGYLLEKEVIIDDFGPNGIDINHLLRWFDRYKCYVEIKGDMCPLVADQFIVTSNFHPSKVFEDKEGVPHPQTDALLRRVQVIEMN